jgi:hypothetical protein
MCGKDNHQTYKDFKRRVVMTAINEINEKSLLHVDLYQENKDGKKVVELVFFVTREEFIEPEQLISDDDLFAKMVEVFGISVNVARKIISTYDNEHIVRNLDYTEQQFKKAVKNKKEKQFNIGAYATSAILKDYAPRQPTLLTKLIEEKEQKKSLEMQLLSSKKQQDTDIISKISQIFDGLEANRQEILKNEFERNGMRGPVKKSFQSDGWSCVQVRTNFFIYLASQIEQGRKGDGYDEIKKAVVKSYTH